MYVPEIICVPEKLGIDLIEQYGATPEEIRDGEYCFDYNQVNESLPRVDKNSPIHFTYGFIFGILIAFLQRATFWNIHILFFVTLPLAIIINVLFHAIKYRFFNVRVAINKHAIYDFIFIAIGYLIPYIILLLI
jgi:hypothetical protein